MDPLPLEGAAVPLLHASSPGCCPLGFSALSCNSPEQLVPKRILFFFLDLEVCFLENPVKRENSREGGSFSRVQTVMCPAVPEPAYLWDAERMGDHVHLPAAEFLCESSSPHCVAVMWSLSTPCLPRPDERSEHPSDLRQQNKTHATEL